MYSSLFFEAFPLLNVVRKQALINQRKEALEPSVSSPAILVSPAEEAEEADWAEEVAEEGGDRGDYAPSGEEAAIELRVNGLGGRVCCVLAQRSWSGRDVRAAIETAAQLPRYRQRLLLGTTVLQDSDLLSAALPEGSYVELTLVVRLPEQAEWLRIASEEWSDLLAAPAGAWEDLEVVLAAVEQCGWALQHASADLKANRQVVLSAVRQNGLALQHASGELRADPEVVLAAVAHCGKALEYAADELRSDKAFILQAVRCNWRSLEHAHLFRGDREVVLAAVGCNGRALAGATQTLRGDHEVVRSAVRRTSGSLAFASGELRADPELLEIQAHARRRLSV